MWGFTDDLPDRSPGWSHLPAQDSEGRVERPAPSGPASRLASADPFMVLEPSRLISLIRSEGQNTKKGDRVDELKRKYLRSLLGLLVVPAAIGLAACSSNDDGNQEAQQGEQIGQQEQKMGEQMGAAERQEDGEDRREDREDRREDRRDDREDRRDDRRDDRKDRQDDRQDEREDQQDDQNDD